MKLQIVIKNPIKYEHWNICKLTDEPILNQLPGSCYIIVCLNCGFIRKEPCQKTI